MKSLAKFADSKEPFFMAVGFTNLTCRLMLKKYWDLYDSSDFEILMILNPDVRGNLPIGTNTAYHFYGELRNGLIRKTRAN